MADERVYATHKWVDPDETAEERGQNILADIFRFHRILQSQPYSLPVEIELVRHSDLYEDQRWHISIL